MPTAENGDGGQRCRLDRARWLRCFRQCRGRRGPVARSKWGEGERGGEEGEGVKGKSLGWGSRNGIAGRVYFARSATDRATQR